MAAGTPGAGVLFEAEGGGGGETGLEAGFDVVEGVAVGGEGLGGGAVGRDDDAVVAHVGVVGGVEEADVAGESGEDDGVDPKMMEEQVEGGGIEA